MRAGADGPVRAALEDAVRRWAPPAAITETGAGDSVLIVADDPVALAQTARHLMDDGLPGARASRACASRCTTARCRPTERDADLRTDDRRRRRDPVRGAGRAGGRAGPDLGDRGIPPAVPRAAVAVADDAGAGARTAATASTSRSPARPSPTPGCVCTGSSPDRRARPPRGRPVPKQAWFFARCFGSTDRRLLASSSALQNGSRPPIRTDAFLVHGAPCLDAFTEEQARAYMHKLLADHEPGRRLRPVHRRTTSRRA